jgi:hypothetical protein
MFSLCSFLDVPLELALDRSETLKSSHFTAFFHDAVAARNHVFALDGVIEDTASDFFGWQPTGTAGVLQRRETASATVMPSFASPVPNTPSDWTRSGQSVPKRGARVGHLELNVPAGCGFIPVLRVCANTVTCP